MLCFLPATGGRVSPQIRTQTLYPGQPQPWPSQLMQTLAYGPGAGAAGGLWSSLQGPRLEPCGRRWFTDLWFLLEQPGSYIPPNHRLQVLPGRGSIFPSSTPSFVLVSGTKRGRRQETDSLGLGSQAWTSVPPGQDQTSMERNSAPGPSWPGFRNPWGQ